MPIDVVADAQSILTDAEGFAQSITVTDPSDVAAALTGFGLEIGTTIEPETGQPVAGARASVSIPLGPFQTAFGAGIFPGNVADGTAHPWRVSFVDAVGTTRTYKIIEVMPDMRLGVLTCTLETYRP